MHKSGTGAGGGRAYHKSTDCATFLLPRKMNLGEKWENEKQTNHLDAFAFSELRRATVAGWRRVRIEGSRRCWMQEEGKGTEQTKHKIEFICACIYLRRDLHTSRYANKCLQWNGIYVCVLVDSLPNARRDRTTAAWGESGKEQGAEFGDFTDQCFFRCSGILSIGKMEKILKHNGMYDRCAITLRG